MMSSQVVVRPYPEQIEAFIAAFNALAAEVIANEDGALAYYLLRSRSDSARFRVVELYRDDAAYEAHKLTAHYKARIGGIVAMLADAPAAEHFDAL